MNNLKNTWIPFSQIQIGHFHNFPWLITNPYSPIRINSPIISNANILPGCTFGVKVGHLYEPHLAALFQSHLKYNVDKMCIFKFIYKKIQKNLKL